MNSISQQTATEQELCCVDYCSKSYETAQETIINAYKCNSRPLSQPDMWNILKQRKQQAIRSFPTSIMS